MTASWEPSSAYLGVVVHAYPAVFTAEMKMGPVSAIALWDDLILARWEPQNRLNGEMVEQLTSSQQGLRWFRGLWHQSPSSRT